MKIKVLKNILGANDAVAESNNRYFKEKNVGTVNLMSSPGSGKTELIDKTLEALAGKFKFAVIEGDIQTTMDADRLAHHNIPIVQINTEPFGGDCHLEAEMVRSAADQFDLDSTDFIIVENVGNLVCPAEFNLGVDRNVVLLSITEGEDKPLKYPLMFRTCDLCILTKMDLLDALDYDVKKTEENLSAVNPEMAVIKLSARSGEGMDLWLDFLTEIRE